MNYTILDLYNFFARMRLLHLFLEESSMKSKTRFGAFILLSSQHITALAFGHFIQVCIKTIIYLNKDISTFRVRSVRSSILNGSFFIYLGMLEWSY